MTDGRTSPGATGARVQVLGLLSDSHGDAETTCRAVDLLIEAGATMLIHLGDIEHESVIDALATEADIPVHLVFGNVDWPTARFTRYAELLGIHVDHPCGRLTVDGKQIVFHHGHEYRCIEAALSDGVDFLLHGHTHVARDDVIAGTRVINPGALHRVSERTVALLTPRNGRLRFITVPC
ncbi:MAG: metallophosphoesterase family protein [Phycisphaerales bacterium]|nr:metallophosphoesterase family protein [Phycisphaerales bacterium]